MKWHFLARQRETEKGRKEKEGAERKRKGKKREKKSKRWSGTVNVATRGGREETWREALPRFLQPSERKEENVREMNEHDNR